ncbi:MAG TPA: type IX secretion system membrane protein PorP/SprF [Cytophagaceae bacterium]|jgi:type IX secretion system PorP/SprF family membrane protein|nr:type IX secretion system membrane protein PorP/SprF [Cytophagaceae bacterium]
MKRFLFLFLLQLTGIILQAQDPQFSQFYANSLYLSPAFAGAQQNTRGIFTARYQWPALDASFFTYTASFDHYFDQYHSGVGVIFNSDLATAANLRTTEAGIQYAFQANLSKKLVFRPGLQISYVARNIDYSKLTFGAQYTDDGFVGGSSNETLLKNHVSYADISSGGLLYSEKFWLGFSANHMNTPNQSFYGQQSNLPAKFSFFGGMKFSFTPAWRKRYINPDEDKSITPTVLYKMQGKSDQLDIGLYARYNHLVVGSWYRGIPIKLYKPERTNNDALIFLIGFVHKGLNIGYSYDLTISKLTMASGGSHEITVIYSIAHKPKKKIMKRLPCPDF